MYRTIMAMTLLIVLVIVSTANAQVTKQDFSGISNLSYCKGPASSLDYSTPGAAFDTLLHSGYCKGIAEGALRALKFSDTTCVPPGVTNGQALLVVVRYMEQHPELLHLDLAVLAADALHTAFACHGSGSDPAR